DRDRTKIKKVYDRVLILAANYLLKDRRAAIWEKIPRRNKVRERTERHYRLIDAKVLFIEIRLQLISNVFVNIVVRRIGIINENGDVSDLLKSLFSLSWVSTFAEE